MSQKTCRICDRTRSETLFPKMGRYRRPYCTPCYNAYQKARGRIDRNENRTLTIKEFKDEVLPLMIEAGDAVWADKDYQHLVPEPEPLALDPNVTLSEEESMARQEAIYQELLRTMPTRLEN